jgi:hypothetical protein
VQWSEEWDPSLADLLAEMPELVLGRYVSIASCDSGPYRPTAEEIANGWDMTDSIAASPIIKMVTDLPMPGFDEWYVHALRPAAYAYQSFVNQYGFSPLDSGEKELNAFWSQIEATKPLHVLGAGTPNMFVVTRNENIYLRAKRFNTSLDTDATRRST